MSDLFHDLAGPVRPRVREQTSFRPGEPLPTWTVPALKILGFYAISRGILLLADSLSAHLQYNGDLAAPLRSWDSHFYLQIAAHGYPASAPRAGNLLTYSPANFQPVFPALVRAAQAIGLTPVPAAMFVSLVAGAVATLLVWRLAATVFDEQVARTAAILFVFFPGMAVAWGLIYSECVGLALVAGALLLMVKERWVWAGVLGALATATNPAALPLALAALVPVVHAVRARRAPKALVTLVGVPLGFLAFAAWEGARYHDVLYWWHLNHQAWGTSIDFGWALLKELPHLWARGLPGPSWLEWMGLLAVVGAVVALVKARAPGVINAYCIGVLVVLFVSDTSGFRPRLLTWAFPALIAVAATTRRRGWQPVALTFAGLLPIAFVVYTTLGNTVAAP